MSPADRSHAAGFTCYAALLTLLFIQPLASLVLYFIQSDLDSHIVLVPLISAYVLYLRRGGLPVVRYHRSIAGMAALGTVGMGALAARINWRETLSAHDGLVLLVFAFVTFLLGGGFLFFGSEWMAARAFPAGFLIFLVPLPDGAVNWLEGASTLASAEAAAFYFDVVGTPLVRQGVVFELPGITLRVAQQCSGIHSSWVLFITSLVVSNVFLKTGWRRLVLVLFVIPLGILRNGFRILVIGLLCVHAGPHMIHSPIHHRGGPIFFVLSLFPLVLSLLWLRSQERRLSPSN